MKNLYERAGINDVAEFYRTLHVSDELLDAHYFHALNRFDIRLARTMFVYDNVRRESSVLDLGCGSGVLALLKRKSVRLTGLDISEQCAETARLNGYDETCVAPLTTLPFDDATFDYVVSLDVLGHIAFEEKDAVIDEIRRVLKADGVTLHGIEVMDRSKRKDYEQMSDEELRHFIRIDGHVGMESLEATHSRFLSRFTHTQIEPRFSLCQPCEELIKQADEYGALLCDADFLDYLRGLSHAERRAFNMAMGYVFDKISSEEIRLPRSEYAFLKASPAPLGPFYNEQRDRRALFPIVNEMGAGQTVRLDHTTRAEFDGGWHEAEDLPPVARWMRERARVRFMATPFKKLRLELQTGLPDLGAPALGLEFTLDGARVASLSLFRFGWLEVEIDVEEIAAQSNEPRLFEFEIRADRTWQPRKHNASYQDDRELSIAVCHIELIA